MDTGKVRNHILIVEDSPDIQELLTRLLKSDGYQVTCASDGQEALNWLNQTSELPGLILLDLKMPGMDGYAFCAERDKTGRLSDIDVVVMSADSDLDAKAAKAGAKGALKKPFGELDDLLSSIRSYF